MSQKTNIQWTDVTDNIIVAAIGGWWCRMISEGCVNCYAAKLNQSEYFGGNHLPYTGKPPELKLRTEIIDGWARMTKPKKHFVASMTDIFGEWVAPEWIFKFLDGMVAAPKQTFQLLTKRADIMRATIIDYCSERGIETLPPNIWVGVSVENQQRADERIPALLKIPAKVRFLSVEPLLGPVNLRFVYDADGQVYPFPAIPPEVDPTNKLHWVIVGGESGNKARPCNAEWIRSVVDQCKSAGVPCFVKQLGAHPTQIPLSNETYSDGTFPKSRFKDKKGGDMAEWPADLRVRQFPAMS